jgi:hypothetical protein
MMNLSEMLAVPVRDLDDLLAMRNPSPAMQLEFDVANLQGSIKECLADGIEPRPEVIALLAQRLGARVIDSTPTGPEVRVKVTQDRDGTYGRVMTNEAPARNGNGGNGSGRPARTASEKQINFLRSLLTTHEAHRLARFEVAATEGKITSKYASEEITRLKALPRPAQTAPAAPAIDVPAGPYAVPGEDETLRFYRVDRPTEGKWAGWTFVKVQASDETYPVKGAARNAILSKIAADPAEASRRYWSEIGRCCRCHRTLTDETSRRLGIGPECRNK